MCRAWAAWRLSPCLQHCICVMLVGAACVIARISVRATHAAWPFLPCSLILLLRSACLCSLLCCLHQYTCRACAVLATCLQVPNLCFCGSVLSICVCNCILFCCRSRLSQQASHIHIKSDPCVMIVASCVHHTISGCVQVPNMCFRGGLASICVCACILICCRLMLNQQASHMHMQSDPFVMTVASWVHHAMSGCLQVPNLCLCGSVV